MARETARPSTSAHLELVRDHVRFSELVRRVRLENGWTQVQLAERMQVRPQTVSAWERGTKPQRRHYAKIAAFLKMSDERAVELLMSGEETGAADVPASEHRPPAPRTDLQERVVGVIVDHLESKGKPSADLTKLFLELMAWANQPVGGVSDVGKTADPGRPEPDSSLPGTAPLFDP